MNTEKPLKTATCTRCGLRFFVSDPRPSREGASRVRTFDVAPEAAEDREIVPFDCPRCKHSQFVEFDYGPEGGACC